MDWHALMNSPWFWTVIVPLVILAFSGLYNDGYRAGRAERDNERLPYDWPHGDHDNDRRYPHEW